MFRQGDLFFVPADLPEGGQEVVRENGRIILARGETTGHAHAVIAPNVRLIEAFQQHFLVAEAPFEIVHEEHGTVEMPAGVFRVVHQREYTPEAIRIIID